MIKTAIDLTALKRAKKENVVCCDCDFWEAKYKIEEKVYCVDCALEKLEQDNVLETSQLTSYRLSGEYIGDENDIDDVLDTLVSNDYLEEL